MRIPSYRAILTPFNIGGLLSRPSGYLLVVLIACSWLMYPLAISLIFPVGTRVLFLGVLTLLLSVFFISDAKLRIPRLTGLQLSILVLWLVYMLCLLIATLYSGSDESVGQFLKQVFKYVFFVFFLVFMRTQFISSSFSLYANIMALLVIMALIVMVGVAMGVMQPIADVEQIQASGITRVLHVYWGGFYGIYPLSAPFPLYRMQSFCVEPGTFALALLPALFWFVIVEQAWFRALLVCLGIMFSVSFGGFIVLGLSLPVLWKCRANGKASMVFLLVVIVGSLTIPLMARNPQIHGVSYIAEKVQGEGSSLGERMAQTGAVFDYIAENPVGTGAGIGLPSDETIANGYAFAVLQSGAFGGSLYLTSFLLVSILSLSQLSSRIYARSVINQRVRAVIALSVLACVIFGLQRMQPDLSIWHMWLYACLFYVAGDRRPVSINAA